MEGLFRILHYLDEINREQSFSRAAQKLYLSQPSLSLTVKKFEQDIGIRIFDRSTSPIQLTEAGRVYMEEVRKILTVESDMDAFLDDYKEVRRGKLVLGAANLFSSCLMPALIAQFADRFPGISIELVEADYPTLYETALGGEVDLLIESQHFDDALFCSCPIFEEHILLAVPETDPVNESLGGYRMSLSDVRKDRHLRASQKAAPLSLFAGCRFLMMKKGYDMHARAMQMFQDSGIEPAVFMSLGQLMTAYNMVEQQLAAAFVTDTIVKLSDIGRHISYYRLEGELTVRPVNLAYKRNRYVSRAMREFIDMVRQLGGSVITAAAGRRKTV